MCVYVYGRFHGAVFDKSDSGGGGGYTLPALVRHGYGDGNCMFFLIVWIRSSGVKVHGQQTRHECRTDTHPSSPDSLLQYLVMDADVTRYVCATDSGLR